MGSLQECVVIVYGPLSGSQSPVELFRCGDNLGATTNNFKNSQLGGVPRKVKTFQSGIAPLSLRPKDSRGSADLSRLTARYCI